MNVFFEEFMEWFGLLIVEIVTSFSAVGLLILGVSLITKNFFLALGCFAGTIFFAAIFISAFLHYLKGELYGK